MAAEVSWMKVGCEGEARRERGKDGEKMDGGMKRGIGHRHQRLFSISSISLLLIEEAVLSAVTVASFHHQC